MAATVVKTIGSTGVFSTLQLWEDGAPASLTTSEKWTCNTFVGTPFTQGETLNFSPSLAVGKFLDSDSSSYVTFGITSGTPAASDVVTGATSLATANLVSKDDTGVIWQGQGQNEEFSGAAQMLAIAGSTESSTAYKELTTAAGASFRDNANVQTNALRYNASNGCGITQSGANVVTININEANARVSKLQIAATGSGGRAISPGVALTGAILDFCIYEGLYTANSSTIGVVYCRGGAWKNSVFVQRATAADHIIATGTTSPSLFNCTIVAADDLATAPVSIFLSGASGTVTVQNCGLFAGGDSPTAAGSATFNFTTCYGDDSTPASGITTATYSSQFQNVNDATRDFRLVTGADMKDTGTTDTTNAAIDIAGTARPSGSAYDVGAWEFVQAGGAAAPSLFVNRSGLVW